MTGVVLDFGGPVREAVYVAFCRVSARYDFKIFVLPTTKEQDLTYREFNGSLKEALASISDGSCSSVQVEGRETSPVIAGLYRPSFAGNLLADWSASAEALGSNAEALFEELQSVDGLGYIALFKEESADFDTERLTEETFPWSDWRLIAGAVRASDGEWIVRRSAA